MIQSVPFDIQRHQAVDPGRLNAPPSAVCFLVSDDPLYAGLDGSFPPWRETNALIEMGDAVREQKHSIPGEEAAAPWQAIVGLGATFREQLVQPPFRRQRARRSAGGEDRQRKQGGSGPAREVVDVEGEPLRVGDDFRGQIGCPRPRPFADQRQPVTREDSDSRQPAVSENPFSGSDQGVLFGAHADRPQGGVTFHRAIDVPRGRLVVALP